MHTQDSGLRIREIKTKTVDVDGTDVVVPELDADGREIELVSIDVPHAVEAEGGEQLEAHVAEQLLRATEDAARDAVTPEPSSRRARASVSVTQE